ncbi:MAG: (Fe-S)-binding protein [Desulfovibrionaceae bacterium]
MAKDRTQSLHELLTVVREEIYKCIRCGECRTVCPVFRENPAERYTARGKMIIAEALATGQLEMNAHVREALDNCLLCTGCASRCSSGARADRVIAATRRAFAKELGIPALKKCISLALQQPNALLALGAGMGSKMQPLLFKQIPRTSGLWRRFAMPVLDKDQFIPQLAPTPFRRRASSERGSKGNVIFFTGCMTNYAMTNIADSLMAVFTALDIGVAVPKRQACCGTPMMACGDVDALEKQARRNVAALAGQDKVVVACSSCGHMLKHGYLDALRHATDLRGPLEDLAARTMDVSEYLVREVGMERLRAIVQHPSGQRVTYHDPCHLKKAQNIVEEPRQLVQLATSGGLTEMEQPDACCGMGGTYFLGQMDISRKIQQRKTEDVLRTGASLMATACPGCIMHLQDGLRRAHHADVQVRHVIQLLAESL